MMRRFGGEMKERLHRLVDELPENELRIAWRVLEALGNRASSLPASLRDAPIDDEPYTDEERRLVQEAVEELERGEYLSETRGKP